MHTMLILEPHTHKNITSANRMSRCMGESLQLFLLYSIFWNCWVQNFYMFSCVILKCCRENRLCVVVMNAEFLGGVGWRVWSSKVCIPNELFMTSRSFQFSVVRKFKPHTHVLLSLVTVVIFGWERGPLYQPTFHWEEIHHKFWCKLNHKQIHNQNTNKYINKARVNT